MKKLFILSVLLLSTNTWALADYGFTSLFRSFPLGAFVHANYGQSIIFWGKAGTKNPLYGYARTEGSFRTSGVINATTARVELFPISIVGVYAGRSFQVRNSNELDTFNCDVVVCDGKVERNFIGIKAAIGAFGFFAMLDFKQIRVNMKNHTGIFADESVTLLARSGNDVADTRIITAGYSISENYKIGVLDMFNKMKYIKGESRMTMAMFQMPFLKAQQLTFATGQFHTRDDQKILSALVIWKWVAKKGAPLF